MEKMKIFSLIHLFHENGVYNQYYEHFVSAPANSRVVKRHLYCRRDEIRVSIKKSIETKIIENFVGIQTQFCIIAR